MQSASVYDTAPMLKYSNQQHTLTLFLFAHSLIASLESRDA